MEEKVRQFIDAVRPMIQSHGGDVEYVGLEGRVVKLKLLGACHTCPHALFTLHQGIEAQLQHEVSPELTVERVE